MVESMVVKLEVMMVDKKGESLVENSEPMMVDTKVTNSAL